MESCKQAHSSFQCRHPTLPSPMETACSVGADGDPQQLPPWWLVVLSHHTWGSFQLQLTGLVAQEVQCLPSKHKALNSSPTHTHTKSKKFSCS
jgi:hypothetical protein